VSDPVLIRADGVALHGFASVVDDMDAGINRILRGEDSLTTTGVALDILSAIGGNPTALSVAHLPLLRDGGGARLEALTLRRLRGDGMEPAAIFSYLANPGGSSAPTTLAELAETFDLRKAAAPATFDIGRLQALNRRALRNLGFADAAQRLPQGASEAFWLAVRENLDLLTEARGWWDVVAGDIVPPVLSEEADCLRAALDLLPPEPWAEDVWSAWLAALARATGRERDELVAPLRLALTGEEDGPELAALLPLIGRTRAAARLRMAAA
jgi:glutamyl-tRNA synthetase